LLHFTDERRVWEPETQQAGSAKSTSRSGTIIRYGQEALKRHWQVGGYEGNHGGDYIIIGLEFTVSSGAMSERSWKGSKL
jgi:hypothetical protein